MQALRLFFEPCLIFNLMVHSRYNPGKLQPRKWENAFTIDKNSWGLNRNGTINDYMTVKELVHMIIGVVAFGGNALVNIGPGPDGTLSPIFVDRLLGIGTISILNCWVCATAQWTFISYDLTYSLFVNDRRMVERER